VCDQVVCVCAQVVCVCEYIVCDRLKRVHVVCFDKLC